MQPPRKTNGTRKSYKGVAGAKNPSPMHCRSATDISSKCSCVETQHSGIGSTIRHVGEETPQTGDVAVHEKSQIAGDQ